MVRSYNKPANYWSKHTSYPTAGSEKTRLPSELNTRARVNNKQAENELETSRNIIDNNRRKSFNTLDSQRKLLEKSMLEYSKKMEKINNEKTNELFREIHTRNSSRNDMRIKSPTSCSGSVSARSNFSLPARLQYAKPKMALTRQRRSYCESLHGFKNINIPTPIPEVNSRGSTANYLKSVDISSSSSPASSITPSPNAIKQTAMKLISLRSSSAARRVSKADSLKDDIISVKSEPVIPAKSYRKINPRVLDSSLPWKIETECSGSDSAYSSASEDLDTLGDITTDTNTEDDDLSSEFILSVPKIHVRKRNKKSRSKGLHKINDDLHRQVVLKQARGS
ncbi:hypothetical protein ACF0H5_002193 [Mactra antiquata]